MAQTARSLGNARLSMLAKPRTLTTRADFVADIRREWTNALEATVAVGRRLIEAKEVLPHGEYEAMVATDLPFSTSTARKLREIAAFVDEGRVPLDQLPEAMSTLYAIATLPEETRQQALETGTIHPAVTRAEVVALKAPSPAPTPPPAPAPLPLLERVDDQSPAASGMLIRCCVAVPELLLFRLEGVLEQQGMLGGATITLRHQDEHLTLHRRDQHYSIEQHFHSQCSYVGSTMSKTRVAEFIRAWLAASAVQERLLGPSEPPVIDVEAVQVAEEPAVQLPPPAVTVKPPRESRFAVTLGQRWEVDPNHPGDIIVQLDGQRRVLLVMVAPDPAAADIVRHVVDLHNAALEG